MLLLEYSGNAGYASDFWLRQITPTSVWLQRISFVDSLTGWAVGEQGVIIHTSDGGQIWSLQNSGINYPIEDIFFLNPRLGWAMANDYLYSGSTVLKTTNGGVNWTSSRYPDTSLILNRIYFLDSLNGWLSGFNRIILQTTNGGLNWIPRQIDSSECFAFPLRNIALFSPQYGFACGGYFDVAGYVLRTTNYGFSWSPRCLSPEPLFDIVIFDSLNVLGVGGDYEFGVGIVRTSNGGINWQYTSLGFFGAGFAADFRTSAEGWMALGFSGTWAYSLDSGSTWNELGPADTILVYDVIFTDPYHGYACGSSGSVLRYNTDLIGIENKNQSIVSRSPVLHQNYPNPFNPLTTIEFSLPKISRVKIALYDVLGKELRVLMNEIRKEGNHRIKFGSEGLPSGVYFYRLTTGSHSETKKLVILR